VVDRQNAHISDTLSLREVAMATTFWLSMGYNFSSMIASDTLFDFRGGFSETSYPMETAEIEGLRDVDMATNFWTTLPANGLKREITTWGFRIKGGLFSINPYVCWSLSL